MEWLDINILYWHWIVAGLILMIFELINPVFVILWLGVASIVVGVLQLFFNINIHLQLMMWVLLSTLFILLWHKYISPRMHDKTMAGLSREAMVGQIGMVIFFDATGGRGKLKFPAPLVGNDEWEFIYEGELSNGDKVKVTDISGNSLLVRQA